MYLLRASLCLWLTIVEYKRERERERDDWLQYAAAIESVKRKKDEVGFVKEKLLLGVTNVVLFRTGWALFGPVINRSKCFLYVRKSLGFSDIFFFFFNLRFFLATKINTILLYNCKLESI